jgi:hypothetical protein
MSQPLKTGDSDQLRDPRELSRWVRLYAQNRSLPMVASLVIFVAFSVAIGGGSYLAGAAYLNRHMVLFAACIVVLVFVIAGLIYVSVPQWGGRRMEQLAKQLYAKEGQVALATTQVAGRRRTGLLLGLVFGACIVASLILGLLGYIPQRYMQPVSALYVVPFLVVLNVLMRPAVGWLMLLWPALYALHAILIVAGAPILFTGAWDGLNMLIPVAGYGLLAGLVAHIYSRFALHRVKRLARMGLSGADGQEEVG